MLNIEKASTEEPENLEEEVKEEFIEVSKLEDTNNYKLNLESEVPQ